MSHNMTFIGLFGLAVNSVFNYSKYFSTFLFCFVPGVEG